MFGSHSSPLFPHLGPILHPTYPLLYLSVSLDCPVATVQGQPPHAALGHGDTCISVLPTGTSVPLDGEGQYAISLLFFIASNTNSCIVGGAEEVVAKWKQILHSHFTLYMLRPLLNKVHIWLSF